MKATGSRIETIAHAHHVLYNQDEFEYLDLGSYLNRIISFVTEIFHQEEKEIGYMVDVSKISLKAGISLTIGLIVNEILVHMYRDAFDHMNRGKISITATKEENNFVLIEISDNGKGIGNLLDGISEESLGSVIIKTLSQKLDASITQQSNEHGGTMFKIGFYT